LLHRFVAPIRQPVRFLVRQEFSFETVDSDRVGHVAGRGTSVAGQHGDLPDADGTKLCDDLRRFRPDRIADPDHADDGPAEGHEERRLRRSF
jgi:hypothetical protein